MNTYTLERTSYSTDGFEHNLVTDIITAEGMQPHEGESRGVVFYNKGDGNQTGEIVAIHYDVERVYLNVVETPKATVTDISAEVTEAEVAEIANAQG